MLTDARGGLRLALRRWPVTLSLGGMVLVIAAVMAVVLGDVLSQVQVMKGGEELRRQHAVSFTPYYLSSDVTHVGEPALKSLQDAIDDGSAYSSVVSNVEIENPNFADGYSAVIIVGEAPVTLFPGLHLCSPAPCAMRGADLHGRSISPIRFAGRTWDPQGVLPHDATFVDPSSAGLVLDDTIVLHVPAREISAFDEYEREEVFTKAIMLHPAASALEEYVTATRADKLALVPHDLAVDQPRNFRDLLVRAAMYLVGMAAFLALVLGAFATTADAALRRETRGFTIRRMYGARPGNVGIRVGTYLAATLLVLPVPVLLALRLIGPPVTGGANVVLGIVLVVFVGLWGAMFLRQRRRDPLER